MDTCGIINACVIARHRKSNKKLTISRPLGAPLVKLPTCVNYFVFHTPILMSLLFCEEICWPGGY